MRIKGIKESRSKTCLWYVLQKYGMFTNKNKVFCRVQKESCHTPSATRFYEFFSYNDKKSIQKIFESCKGDFVLTEVRGFGDDSYNA